MRGVDCHPVFELNGQCISFRSHGSAAQQHGARGNARARLKACCRAATIAALTARARRVAKLCCRAGQQTLREEHYVENTGPSMRKREVRGLALEGDAQAQVLGAKLHAQCRMHCRSGACQTSAVNILHACSWFGLCHLAMQPACMPSPSTGKPEVLAHIHNGELISMVKRNNELFQRGAQVESGWG